MRTSETPHNGSGSYRPKKSRPAVRGIWIAYAVTAVALVAVLVAVLVPVASPTDSKDRAVSGLHTSASVASMLELSPLSASGGSMPEFHLTDQHGNAMSLAEFRGRAVVLSFNDDRCKDLCTLLAEDVLAADKDLGSHQESVAFVSINANPYYPTVSDVGSWTKSHGLQSSANWYFGTGSPQQLKAVADAYGVPVTRDAKDKTVEHGTEVFYIDPEGREVGVGGFGNTSANTALYGHDMAKLAMSLLPKTERHDVAGNPGQPARISGALGSSPSVITLPGLRGDGQVSTAADPNHYTVLNFWSSSCTACVSELPDFQKVHKQFVGEVNFVGIDVADSPALGMKLVSETGIDYPVADDSLGQASGAFEIAELPFTVILDPAGAVVVRHPGLFTSQQLAYVLEDLEPSLHKLDTGVD
ncbi:MAG: redoxin domain-containing protein [Lacisediminihabitans sp.]